MAFTVVYDANVLYPAPLRDLLIRLAMTGVVRVKWTDEILDEVFRNLLENRPDLTQAQLARTRGLMNAAVRDVLVDGYQPLVAALDLPDSGDRHVLAAAIQCGAQSIITHNLRDFPKDKLGPYGVEAISNAEMELKYPLASVPIRNGCEQDRSSINEEEIVKIERLVFLSAMCMLFGCGAAGTCW